MCTARARNLNATAMRCVRHAGDFAEFRLLDAQFVVADFAPAKVLCPAINTLN